MARLAFLPQTVAVRAWIQAMRPLAQVNIAIPLVLGEMLALHATGELDIAMLVAAHIFGVLDQLFIVFANDVADEAGDKLNTTHNLFSGGSRVLPEGKLSRKALVIAATICAGLMLLLSVGLAASAARPSMLLGCTLAVALLWAYSYRPLRLSYRGYGEVTQGLGVGLVLPAIGYYLQTGELHTVPWLALVPAIVLGVASNITTALPDHPADVAVDKKAWPVRFGQARARKHSLQLIALGALLTPVVVPELEHTALLAIEIGPALALLLNLRGLPNADAEHAGACRRFVFFNGLAINLTLLGWCFALATA